MCVGTVRTVLIFPKTINLRGHMPRFTWKINVFPLYVFGNPINGCWNPQNSAHFSKTIDLRGHMPRFTLKMNVFLPCISLETLEMCVETLKTGLIFQRLIDLRGHMPRFTLKNECFPIYLLGETAINVCWNPQNSACFSKTIDLRVTCLGLL